jgi:tetratricopeptide (TPR) repeat protein/tRNA A-37 threonylcarbamoyl transferase component Bud32
MAPQPPERLELVDQILGSILSIPPEERARFLEDRCSGDPSLRQSVLRLLGKFDQLGDFLERPAYGASDRPEPGDLLAGRFRIVRELGAGGMGQVYEAEDQVLHEPIALKMIRPDLRQHEEVESRFRDEIRLARKIAHPNVCRTFDVFSGAFRDRPFLFYTMELLEGETLAARLGAHGPLPPETALRIAAQIAAGLDAAHSLDIVHRDLKPANIMLVRPPGRDTERAVITDFGLARSFEQPAGGATRAGQLLGSPPYMAPEQFVGADVSTAADIYSFGMIVFEMVAGKRPFPDEDIVRAAIRRSTVDPPPLSSLAPEAPPGWSAILGCALSRDPAARMRSSGELVRLLERSAGKRRPVSRRTLVYGAAGIAIVSSSAAAFRLYQSRGARLRGSPLLMFANATPSGPQSQAASAFMTLLQRQLDPARVASVSRERIYAAWRRMRPDGAPLPEELAARDARELALRTGANLVAFTGATRKLDDWSFWIRLELLGSSPAAAVSYWEREFKASLAGDRFTASTAAARWIRDTLGAAVPPNLRERTPQELTTPNWEALEEFTQAEIDWPAGNRDAAIRHLKTALDLDPDFPLAANRMADTLTASGRIDEGLLLYQRAADLARKRNLTDRESLRMRALFALDTGQSAACEEAASRWLNEYPEDAVALVHRATALEQLGQVDAALRLLDEAVRRMPDSRAPRMRRAIILLRGGRFADADRDCDALARIPPVDSTWQLRASLHVAALNMDAAWDALERMRRAPAQATQSSAFNLQACHRAEQRRYAEAERLLDEGIRFDRENTARAAELKKRRLLAQLLLLEDRRGAAVEQCRLALAANPGHAQAMEIGCVLAQAGDSDGARACRREGLPPWPIYAYWQARLEASILLASGNSSRALDTLLSAPSDPAQRLAGWPVHLVRAALLARRPAAVRESLDALLANPARYWFNADVTGPGYLDWALRSLDTFLDAIGRERASAIRKALAANAPAI